MRVVLGMCLIKGPFHHQVMVRVAALIGIVSEVLVLLGVSTNWQLQFMAWDLRRQQSKGGK